MSRCFFCVDLRSGTGPTRTISPAMKAPPYGKFPGRIQRVVFGELSACRASVIREDAQSGADRKADREVAIAGCVVGMGPSQNTVFLVSANQQVAVERSAV